jgi:peptidyl carrier protein
MSGLATMEQELIDYIAEVWLGGDAEGLDAEAPILELNIIDSAAIFDLVHHLQDRFRISVPLQEIAPENFRTVGAIAALVDRLREEGAR